MVLIFFNFIASSYNQVESMEFKNEDKSNCNSGVVRRTKAERKYWAVKMNMIADR